VGFIVCHQSLCLSTLQYKSRWNLLITEYMPNTMLSTKCWSLCLGWSIVYAFFYSFPFDLKFIQVQLRLFHLAGVLQNPQASKCEMPKSFSTLDTWKTLPQGLGVYLMQSWGASPVYFSSCVFRSVLGSGSHWVLTRHQAPTRNMGQKTRKWLFRHCISWSAMHH
jgi:hypothetical protein